MHEMGLVQSIIEIVQQEMDRHSVREIKAVHLSIGKMACVVPTQMMSCYNILTEDTKLSGSELSMKMIPVTYRCRVCKDEFLAEGFSFRCPVCAAEDPELISGRELQVDFLEVAD